MADDDYIAQQVSRNMQRASRRSSGQEYSLSQSTKIGQLDFPTAPQFNFRPNNTRSVVADYGQQRPDLMRLNIPKGIGTAIGAGIDYMYGRADKKRADAEKERKKAEAEAKAKAEAKAQTSPPTSPSLPKTLPGIEKAQPYPSDPTVPYSDYPHRLTFPEGNRTPNPADLPPGVPYSTIGPRKTFPQGNPIPGLGSGPGTPPPGVPYSDIRTGETKPNGDPFPPLKGWTRGTGKPEGPGVPYSDIRTRRERVTPGSPVEVPGASGSVPPATSTVPTGEGAQQPKEPFGLTFTDRPARPPKGVPYTRLKDKRTMNRGNLDMVRDDIMPGTPEAEEYTQRMKGTKPSAPGMEQVTFTDPAPQPPGRRGRGSTASPGTPAGPVSTTSVDPGSQPTTPRSPAAGREVAQINQSPTTGAANMQNEATTAPGLSQDGTLGDAPSVGNVAYGVQAPKSDAWRQTTFRQQGNRGNVKNARRRKR